MSSFDPQIVSFHGHCHHPMTFFMTRVHFTMDQMYSLKINDHQLFFPQAYGTEVNYYSFLHLSADNLSDQGHTPLTARNLGQRV